MTRPGRIAALYDIHGNVPALEAVLDEIREEGVEEIVVGGDVLPGPMGSRALEMLQSLDTPVRVLRGNGERETLSVLDGGEPALPTAVVESLRWSAEQLTESQVAWLRSWPAVVRLEIEGLGSVLFCHGTPGSDTEILTRLTPGPVAEAAFKDVEADLVVCGHTHMQFDRGVGEMRVVNAGSVGMPFAPPGAYWVSLDRDVRLRRTTYPLAEAAERIRRTAYPAAEEFATRDVLAPRSEAEMLAAFEPSPGRPSAPGPQDAQAPGDSPGGAP
ncbi:MAG: metallophosphoesterase family protein [Longimicrobiales bacterium]|nr:metallophosphoesterase family protein [Longimicrobiales bacterium]